MQATFKWSTLLLGTTVLLAACNTGTTPQTVAEKGPQIVLSYVSTTPAVNVKDETVLFTAPKPVFIAKAIPNGSNVVTEFQYSINNGPLKTIKSNNAFELPVTAAGEYNVEFFAKDNKGLKSEAFEITVVVDASAPTINVTAPNENQDIKGNAFEFNLAASDSESGIAALILRDSADVILCQKTFTADPGTPATTTCAVNTTVYQDGEKTFKVQAVNGVGTATTKELKVNIKNDPTATPPVVKVTKIQNTPIDQVAGKTFSGTLQVYVDAQDVNGIKSVELLVNGNPTPAKTSAPFVFSVDTTQYENGPLTIAAKATNNLNVTGFSAGETTITIDNQVPPLLSISSPADGAEVSGKRPVTLLITKRNSDFKVVANNLKVAIYDYRGDLVEAKTVDGIVDNNNGTYETDPFDFSARVSDYYDIKATGQIQLLNAQGQVVSTQNLNSEVRVISNTTSLNPPAVIIHSPVRMNEAQSLLPVFVNSISSKVFVELTDDVQLGSAELRLTCDTCAAGTGPVNALLEHIELRPASSAFVVFDFNINGTPYLPNGTYTIRVKGEDDSTPDPRYTISEVKVKVDRTKTNPTAVQLVPVSVAASRYEPGSATYLVDGNVFDLASMPQTFSALYFVRNPEGEVITWRDMRPGTTLQKKISVVFDKPGAWAFGGQLQDMSSGEVYPLSTQYVNVTPK